MFEGRIPEIDTIERCLYQAKNGNPIHFLIQGERGIGKSSLFVVIDVIASGEADTGEDRFRFLVISVDLGGTGTQIDIVRAIGRELKRVMDSRQALKARAQAFWNWLSGWEVLGVRYHRDFEVFDPLEATDTLVGNLATLCADLKDEIDGVLILIDEADRPGEQAGLGALCKLFTERLTRLGCSNVILGLAGLPTLLAQLRNSHESSPRIFTTMLLEPLLDHERKNVIRKGLEQANKKNADKVSIDDPALTLLASMSEGYPHFIQEFAYSAFEASKDRTIDVNDVLMGAYAENGALWQLGDKYFSAMYHSKIASDDYRTVLHTMARHGDSWCTRKVIIQDSGLHSSTVTNALNALKAREIILSDESRKGRGFYRLPTRSFAAWLNAIKSVREQSGVTLPLPFE